MLWLLGLVLGLNLVFAYLGGVGDSAETSSTTLSTHAISPHLALSISSIMIFAGSFFGGKVAYSITNGIINTSHISLGFVVSVLVSVVTWIGLCYWLSLPTSETRALIGAIMGAGVAFGGWQIIIVSSLIITFLSNIFAPLLAFAVAALITKLILKLLENAPDNPTRRIFIIFNYFSVAFFSFSIGQNSTQKQIGLGLLAMAIYQQTNINFDTSLVWVFISIIAFTRALGAGIGGSRLIKTIGFKLSRQNLVQTFTTQISASITNFTASSFGIPVSSSQISTSSLVGASFGRRKTSVRWGIFEEIIASWLITIPVTFALGYGLYQVVKYLGI
jgi:inorganic phosphate transporter, PiT family